MSRLIEIAKAKVRNKLDKIIEGHIKTYISSEEQASRRMEAFFSPYDVSSFQDKADAPME